MQTLGSRLSVTLRALRAVLANPSLRRLQLAFLVFNAVESGTWVAILLYAYEATGPASVGLVALAQLVPAGLCAPLAATLGDHHPREKVLLGGYLLFTLMLAVTATAMLAGWPPMATYVAAIGATCVLTLVRPSQSALLPSLAKTAEELTAANAVSSITQAAGLLLGPLAAAAILAQGSPGTVIGALAVATVLAAAVVAPLAMRRPTVRSIGTEAPASTVRIGWLQMTEGFRALSTDRDARLVVAVLSSRMLMIGVADVLFVLLALELFASGEAGAAVLTAALGAGGLLGGSMAFLLIGYPRIAPVLAACAATWAIAFACLLLPAAPGGAPLLVAVAGTGLAVMEVAGRTILQRAVPNEVLARVFGVLEGLDMWALGAGSLLVTLVVTVAGLEGSVMSFAALLPLIIALSWPALSALDRRTRVPSDVIDLLGGLRLFGALHPAAIEGLARAATRREVPAGVTLIREGAHGDLFYVIESGAVSAWKGERLLRRMANRGDSFGEIALLHDIPRTATIRVEEPATLLAISRNDFLTAVNGTPAVALEAARVAQARLADEEA